MKKKYISIIIPTYNRSGFLREAIDSVLKQTWKDFELIIVDDGSTDNTQELLSNYTGKISLISTEHKGPSAARNRGIQTAQGEYITFLDSDDIWKPDKLKKQMDFFKNNPHIFICQTEEIWIRKGRRVNPRKKHVKHSGWIFEKCLPLCIVSPSSVMLHRRVFDRVGLFDEKMPACEDYDLWLRVTPHYQIHLIDEPLIIKRGGHDDQQSYRIPALDRLRIQALCKVLDSGYLTFLQYDKALEELQKKCSIYGNGCLKRGKQEEGETILKLPDRYKRQ